jgi:putative endonuclease
MNTRSTGSAWEKQASEYLEAHGMRIRERNYRNRHGEVDLIGTHEGYLVFVEVKYRSGASKGYAAEAVDYRKQCRICKVADYYRFVHRLGDAVSVRYDVVAVQENHIEWIKNAFPHRFT